MSKYCTYEFNLYTYMPSFFIITSTEYGKETHAFYIYLNCYRFPNCTFELHQVIDPPPVYFTLVFPLVSQLIQLSAVKNSHVYIPACNRQIQHPHTHA